jgi:hypothetical protein
LYNLPFLPFTLLALAVVNGEFIAVCGRLVYSGVMGLKHGDSSGVKEVQKRWTYEHQKIHFNRIGNS